MISKYDGKNKTKKIEIWNFYMIFPYYKIPKFFEDHIKSFKGTIEKVDHNKIKEYIYDMNLLCVDIKYNTEFNILQYNRGVHFLKKLYNTEFSDNKKYNSMINFKKNNRFSLFKEKTEIEYIIEYKNFVNKNEYIKKYDKFYSQQSYNRLNTIRKKCIELKDKSFSELYRDIITKVKIRRINLKNTYFPEQNTILYNNFLKMITPYKKLKTNEKFRKYFTKIYGLILNLQNTSFENYSNLILSQINPKGKKKKKLKFLQYFYEHRMYLPYTFFIEVLSRSFGIKRKTISNIYKYLIKYNLVKFNNNSDSIGYNCNITNDITYHKKNGKLLYLTGECRKFKVTSLKDIYYFKPNLNKKYNKIINIFIPNKKTLPSFNKEFLFINRNIVDFFFIYINIFFKNIYINLWEFYYFRL